MRVCGCVLAGTDACQYCANNPCQYCAKCVMHEKPKPKTNSEKIRAMSDEELAERFAYYDDCGVCAIHDFCFADGSARDCEDVWLDWLKQEEKA